MLKKVHMTSFPRTKALLFGIVMGAILLEAGVRILHIPYATKYLQPDQVLGFDVRPNASGAAFTEGPGYWSTNRWGMRDTDVTLNPAPGIRRVAFLGDSFIASTHTFSEDTIDSVLESRLLNTEVLNFGTNGFSTAQSLLKYRLKVRKFQPDLVILGFLSGNDPTDNVIEADTSGMDRPYMIPKPNGEWDMDTSFLEHPRQKIPPLLYKTYLHLTDTFRLLAVLDMVRFKYIGAMHHFGQLWQAHPIQATSNIPNTHRQPIVNHKTANTNTNTNSNTEMQHLLDVSIALIKQINSDVRNDGAQFLVVLLPHGGQANERSCDAIKDGSIPDTLAFDQSIQDRLTLDGIRVLNTTREFVHRKCNGNEVLFNGGNGHLSPLGNKLIANALRNSVTDMLDGTFERRAMRPLKSSDGGS